ncbi:MAG TPA: ABC transporter substrate-binding protein [Actinomycetes bacterium]|nr:ABC transporter substrate-binding protein [Actinomycetes bacterium]
MGKRRRLLGMVGLALAIALVAAACGGGGGGGGGGGAGAAEKGGVFRAAVDDFGYTNAFDPTGEYLGAAFTMYGALLRTLVSYKHVGGAEGNKLYPDLASEMPAVSSDGLTYTFKLKQGIKFGPPVGRAITSKDVEYAFERINTKPLVAQYGFYYNVIRGLDTSAPQPAPVSGIETPDDATIIFHLTAPTGDFLYRLAMPATAPIPQEVAKCFKKAGDYGRYVVSSGPYMIKGADQLDISSCGAMKPISGFDPTKKLLLVRNPNYDQATDDLRTNNPDGISLTIDTNINDIFNKVQQGTLDSSWTNVPPKSILQQYLTQPDKKNLLHLDSGDRTWYITLNLATQPFDDIHVRKAANLIIDKAAMLQAWGGSSSGEIATHIMPPTLLSDQLKQDYDPYASDGFHGDLAKAQAEMKQSKYDTNKDGLCDAAACKNLVMINRNVTPWSDTEPVVVSSLAKIGIQVKPRELAASAAYTTIQTVKNQIPIALNPGWGKDYPDPYSFAVLFAKSSIIATGNTNYSLVGLTPSQAGDFGIKIPAGTTIPSVDSDIDACQAITATDPNRVSCWVNLDRKVMEEVVPWVPYLWATQPTVVNPSVTHFEFDQFSTVVSVTEVAVNNKIDASTLS